MSLSRMRRKRHAEINIVPLLDVLTTILLYCLVMMQFKHAQTLNIALPEIDTAGKSSLSTSINIDVTRDGTYYINQHIVTANELEGFLSTLGRASDKPPMVIRADEGTPLKNVTFLMDACRKTGFEDFRLQSRESK